MKLIVGLGNPGNEYAKTRHNVGFMAIDNYLGSDNNFKEKFKGLYIEKNVNGEKIIFLKPQKYMNLSGEVVISFVKFYKININDILIIHDDLDLPVGKIKLRMAGGCGGHNGLRDIEKHLGSKNYKRIKVGISNNKQMETKNYVLGKFNSEEIKVMDEAILKISSIINDFPKLTFENLMNKYN